MTKGIILKDHQVSKFMTDSLMQAFEAEKDKPYVPFEPDNSIFEEWEVIVQK